MKVRTKNTYPERSHFGHTTSHVLMHSSQIRIIEGEHGIIAYEPVSYHFGSGTSVRMAFKG